MLKLLALAEKELPALLEQPALWNTLYVDYHPPLVERAWTPWGEHRLYLHRIHPCQVGESLFHPHPWPQAAKVLSGEYEMAVGYGTDHDNPPPYAATLLIKAGTAYEMVDPDGWHYVRPIGTPSLSIMITGKPWKTTSATKTEKPELKPLSEKLKTQLLADFKKIINF
jgi:hypothetical protein